MPVAGGTPKILLPDSTIDDAMWTADGNSVLAVVNVGVHNEVFRIDTRSIHAHLAGSHDAIDVTFWHALQDPRQKIVDSLSGRFLSDGKPRDSILA